MEVTARSMAEGGVQPVHKRRGGREMRRNETMSTLEGKRTARHAGNAHTAPRGRNGGSTSSKQQHERYTSRHVCTNHAITLRSDAQGSNSDSLIPNGLKADREFSRPRPLDTSKANLRAILNITSKANLY